MQAPPIPVSFVSVASFINRRERIEAGVILLFFGQLESFYLLSCLFKNNINKTSTTTYGSQNGLVDTAGNYQRSLDFKIVIIV